MNKIINKKIEENEKEILEFAKLLISVPTQNPPCENYQKIVDIIRKELQHFDTKIYSKNDKPNLIVRWDVGSKNTLHINGHYDVVPVTSNWTFEPFNPVVKDGKLYGRGAQDMKSSLAVMVYSLKLLKELKLKPACNIELSFTCDEESGGLDGLGYLVNEKLINPTFALILDGPNEEINNSHKGVLALEIKVIGKSYHAAWPQKGINAFIGACELSKELNDLNLKLSKIKSKCDTNLEIEKYPTLVLGGMIKGGNKFNTVPGEFSFTIDRRIIPEEKIKDAKKQILEIIHKFEKKNPQYKIEVLNLLEAMPSFVDKNSKISRVLYDSINEVKGKPPKYALLPGFLDMRFFVNDAKIDCVNYGVKGGNLHSDDEFVYVATLYENMKILISAMSNPKLKEN